MVNVESTGMCSYSIRSESLQFFVVYYLPLIYYTEQCYFNIKLSNETQAIVYT